MFEFKKLYKQVIVMCLGMMLCSCASNNYDPNSPLNETTIEVTNNQQEQTDEKNDSSIENELVGIWHASPSVGAGYNNLFFFYKDNKFKLNYSQYDEEKRTLDVSGKWSVDKDKLILLITQKTVIVGGELGEASPSATSKYSIENGKVQKEVLDSPETIEYDLVQFEKATDSPYGKKISIDKVFYWKISDDPEDKDYNEEFSQDSNDDTILKNHDSKQIENKFKTYANEKYGYSINYPISWNISEESPSSDGVVLYDHEQNNIRVFGGYLLGDSTDTIEMDEAKRDGSKIEELITTNGEKAYKILKEELNKVSFHYIVHGSKTYSHLYAYVSPRFYKENESLLLDLAKSIGLAE